MSDILEQILESKRAEVAERRARLPVDALKETITTLGRPRNFFNAVARKPTKPANLIAELKKATPAAGVIRADYEPVAVARACAAAGAEALSVVTDERFFQGHLDHVHAVRDAVKLPVMRQDFVIDPYQVYESRAAGADAVLLVAGNLDTGELIDLQILATELNMTCVIEVHEMEDLIRVRDAVIGFPHRSYSLLAINNRDLRTGRTSLGTTLRMSELVEDREVLISVGGIATREDVEKLEAAGVRAAMVGEALLRSADIGAKVTELFE